MKRRIFVKSSAAAIGSVALQNDLFPFFRMEKTDKKDIKDYLQKILYTREEVDGWFAGKMFPFSIFHSEFGWLLNNNSFRDGINKSWSVYTYRQPDGERIMTNYSRKTCRINTYGDSFTMCHQVSDNETWQEVLAAHIQEPVRNFGIGGWSVYQAYLRMLREEKRTPAELIIFNIYEDDHFRNLDSWRNIRARKHPQHIEATLPFLKVDIRNGKIIDNPNPCPTMESYYDLCDTEKAFRLFNDDFVLRIMIAHEKSSESNPGIQYENLMKLSQTHGIESRIDTGKTLSSNADLLFREAALFSTTELVKRIEEFGKVNGKKVLYVLSYPAGYISRYHSSGQRWDQSFIEFLKNRNLPLVDLAEKHLEDFRDYKCDMNTYLAKYFIGHYNPAGNFFCAHAIRDKLLEITDPAPAAYLFE